MLPRLWAGDEIDCIMQHVLEQARHLQTILAVTCEWLLPLFNNHCTKTGRLYISSAVVR